MEIYKIRTIGSDYVKEAEASLNLFSNRIRSNHQRTLYFQSPIFLAISLNPRATSSIVSYEPKIARGSLHTLIMAPSAKELGSTLFQSTSGCVPTQGERRFGWRPIPTLFVNFEKKMLENTR